MDREFVQPELVRLGAIILHVATHAIRVPGLVALTPDALCGAGWISMFDEAVVGGLAGALAHNWITSGELGQPTMAYAKRAVNTTEARRLAGRCTVNEYLAVHDIDTIL